MKFHQVNEWINLHKSRIQQNATAKPRVGMSVEQVEELTRGAVIMLACGLAAPEERVDPVRLLFEQCWRLVCSPAAEVLVKSWKRCTKAAVIPSHIEEPLDTPMQGCYRSKPEVHVWERHCCRLKLQIETGLWKIPKLGVKVGGCERKWIKIWTKNNDPKDAIIIGMKRKWWLADLFSS